MSCIAKKGQAISAGMLLADRDLGDPKRRDPWESIFPARRLDEPCREPSPNRSRDYAFVFR